MTRGLTTAQGRDGGAVDTPGAQVTRRRFGGRGGLRAFLGPSVERAPVHGYAPWFALSILVPVLSSLVACGGAPRPSIDAWERCQVAHETLTADRAGAIARACADLYSEPTCRDAWRTWEERPPEARVAVVVAACREAYCPKLPHPLPTLCEVQDLTVASYGTFPTLNAQILAYELGIETPPDWTLPVVAAPPPRFATAPAVAREVEVRLRSAPGGGVVVWFEGVSVTIAHPEPGAMVDALRAAHGATVTVVVDQDVPFAAVGVLTGDLYDVGAGNIRFGTPSP